MFSELHLDEDFGLFFVSVFNLTFGTFDFLKFISCGDVCMKVFSRKKGGKEEGKGR